MVEEMVSQDLEGCPTPGGRRQVRRACFINNGCLNGKVEHRESRGVVIEAKHFEKALRWAYKSTAILSTTCRTYRGLCQNRSSQ